MLPPDGIRSPLSAHDDPDRRERPRNSGAVASARRLALLTAAPERRFGPSGSTGPCQDAGAQGRCSVADGAGPAGGTVGRAERLRPLRHRGGGGRRPDRGPRGGAERGVRGVETLAALGLDGADDDEELDDVRAVWAGRYVDYV